MSFQLPNTRSVTSSEQVSFHCKRCGACCRYVRESVPLAEDIEYAGGKPKDDSEDAGAARQPEKAPLPTEAPGEFTGYEPFGGTSFFDDDEL